ncbi:hypothetical protein CROQUDRAFT_100851 [Cronartium quercuum f. sp. fusiforme G11]|uniref:Uncharacterized protein n=1 Tax=Cronartium quercuum f. sp. fusiforme G11 TaxID=708437 RepID=A0A9P6N931_9BASI|nr:hypothetical protein CROQUDRAFT_100851 [Cronartium quercuum f. sp. fusiforme G11]
MAMVGLDVNPRTKTYRAPLETFVDANWGGKFAQSSYGHVTRLFGMPVSWVARWQACVAMSTCHAEFMAIVPLSMFPRTMQQINGKGMWNMSFYINEQLYKKRAALEWVPGSEQLADMFTKPLGPQKHGEAIKQLGMVEG